MMQNHIDEFMKQKRFAVVGATDNTEKFGYKIFKNLQERGYDVYPVNPKLEKLEETKAYHTISDIPVSVDVVDFVVPPKVTLEILKECNVLGLKKIWLQPGSESEEAIKYCDDNGMTVLHGV